MLRSSRDDEAASSSEEDSDGDAEAFIDSTTNNGNNGNNNDDVDDDKLMKLHTQWKGVASRMTKLDKDNIKAISLLALVVFVLLRLSHTTNNAGAAGSIQSAASMTHTKSLRSHGPDEDGSNSNDEQDEEESSSHHHHGSGNNKHKHKHTLDEDEDTHDPTANIGKSSSSNSAMNSGGGGGGYYSNGGGLGLMQQNMNSPFMVQQQQQQGFMQPGLMQQQGLATQQVLLQQQQQQQAAAMMQQQQQQQALLQQQAQKQLEEQLRAQQEAFQQQQQGLLLQQQQQQQLMQPQQQQQQMGMQQQNALMAGMQQGNGMVMPNPLLGNQLMGQTTGGMTLPQQMGQIPFNGGIGSSDTQLGGMTTTTGLTDTSGLTAGTTGLTAGTTGLTDTTGLVANGLATGSPLTGDTATIDPMAAGMANMGGATADPMAAAMANMGGAAADPMAAAMANMGGATAADPMAAGTTSGATSNSEMDQVASEIPLNDLANFRDSWAPYSATDIPIYFHIPKAGGSTVKDVIGSCLRMVMASEFGITDGHADDTEIAVVYPKVPGGTGSEDRSPFVNVDTTTVAGIDRAAKMGFADSGLAGCVITPFLYESNALFTQSARGRLFAVFRHPVDRAVSMFYYVQVATWEPSYMPELQSWTLEQYATSPVIENNWMTRQLANQLSGELNDSHLKIAMEVIRRKFMVGLMNQLPASMTRFEKFYRFKYHVNPTNQEACRERLTAGGSNSNSKNKKEKPKEGEPLWDLLAAQNLFDIQLYEYIETLFVEQEAFVADIPDDFRNIDATCCKCTPPTFPLEGFSCPKKVLN